MQQVTRGRKVLLIDDDPDDSKYFAEALHEIDNSIQYISANDGEQGLAILNDPFLKLPDFIFLDLRMPKINGK